ncbi:hypothetical protein [Alkalihalobacillus sp. TS-13]|uniref:hypothetical protein n=1 Tax=Alkalihalobacillus sp. TS-13 TaxID=2842455 RepID=UPI001C86C7D0|nr:hypothetical protein [Alkalihalobacillus sp. TS-13]
MSKWAYIRSRWLNYTLDILLLLLITTWLYAPFERSVIVPTLIVMIGGGILYEMILPRMELTTGKIILTIPVIWGIGLVAGLSEDFFYLAVLGVVTALRFSGHYADADLQQEFPIFLSTIIGAIAFFFLYNTNDQLVYVLWIAISQFCMFVFVRLNRMMVQQPANPNLKRLLYYMISAFFVFSVIIAIFLPVVKAGAFFVLKIVTAVLSLILFLPLNAFFNWFASIFSLGELQQEDDGQEGTVEIKPEELGELNNIEASDTLLNIILLIGLILLVWYGYKYYKNKIKIMDYSTVSAGIDSRKAGGMNPKQQFGFKRNKPPENNIRKQLYKLEKRMAKFTFGRFQHESVSEWMDRVNGPEELQGEIDRIYKWVRYGEEDVPELEAEQYRKSISAMNNWAKKKYRSTKKEDE